MNTSAILTDQRWTFCIEMYQTRTIDVFNFHFRFIATFDGRAMSSTVPSSDCDQINILCTLNCRRLCPVNPIDSIWTKHVYSPFHHRVISAFLGISGYFSFCFLRIGIMRLSSNHLTNIACCFKFTTNSVFEIFYSIGPINGLMTRIAVVKHIIWPIAWCDIRHDRLLYHIDTRHFYVDQFVECL
jgi:hypothetical protein